MTIDFVARFEGYEADKHRLPAFEAAQSLHGLARGFTVASHYLGTGIIRKRYPFESQVQVFMHPPRRGSFETLFQIISDPMVQAFGGAIAGGITANFASDFIKHVYRRVIGADDQIQTAEVKQIDEERPGDIDALAEAVEPGIRMAHTAIGHGAETVIIVAGQNNVVNFNGGTKSYLETSIRGNEEEVQAVSVGSYNVNSRMGRAFFSDLGRTVPFHVMSNCASGTVAAISYSLNQYAQGLPSDILITFLRTKAVDGTLKRISVSSAGKI